MKNPRVTKNNYMLVNGAPTLVGHDVRYEWEHAESLEDFWEIVGMETNGHFYRLYGDDCVHLQLYPNTETLPYAIRFMLDAPDWASVTVFISSSSRPLNAQLLSSNGAFRHTQNIPSSEIDRIIKMTSPIYPYWRGIKNGESLYRLIAYASREEKVSYAEEYHVRPVSVEADEDTVAEIIKKVKKAKLNLRHHNVGISPTLLLVDKAECHASMTMELAPNRSIRWIHSD